MDYPGITTIPVINPSKIPNNLVKCTSQLVKVGHIGPAMHLVSAEQTVKKARHHCTCNISHGHPTPSPVRTPHANLIEHRGLQRHCPIQPRFELGRVQCPGQPLMVSQICKFLNIGVSDVYVPVTTVTLPLSDSKSSTLCLLYPPASPGIGSEAPDPLAMILGLDCE